MLARLKKNVFFSIQLSGKKVKVKKKVKKTNKNISLDSTSQNIQWL